MESFSSPGLSSRKKWCVWLVVWPALVSLAVCESMSAEEEAIVSGGGGGQPEIYIPLNGLLRLVNSNSRQMGKRNPFGISARGFHEDIFDHDYGSFSPMRKRSIPSEELHSRNKRSIDPKQHQKVGGWSKRRPEMDSSGFHGDTFSSGFGDFWTMRKKAMAMNKRRPEMDSAGFYGDTFTNGFGDFWTVRKKPADYADYDFQPKRTNK
ncbi:uncharacterized protein LOC132192516 [Neocloeon triangulifer]|uniref:uncharacterized protein LOC132192516 n=1 Tax=Neocloeon triangulifer TaxID=2078957 RepID=UPI00286EED6E|nr:uncharacterized protein LOC132192516 [Neocloeon triangulifer]